MDRARLVTLALVAAALPVRGERSARAAGPESNHPCDGLVAPAELAVRENDLGAPRTPCAERRVYLRLRGSALVDLPAFYGTLDGAALLGARAPLGAVELSAQLRVIDWRFAQNASIKASETTFGPLALGVLLPRRPLDGLAIAPSVRVIVPGTRTGLSVTDGAIELSAPLALRPRRWLSLHAQPAFLAAFSGDVSFTALALSAGAGFLPARWFAATAGLEVQSGWYAPLDHILARASLRLLTRRFGTFDLAALVPLAGHERTDLTAGLDWSLPF